MIRLGQKARDKITGFEGIIVSRVTYITGCDQYGIAPAAVDGEVKSTQYFDEGRIDIINSDSLVLNVQSEQPGGVSRDCP